MRRTAIPDPRPVSISIAVTGTPKGQPDRDYLTLRFHSAPLVLATPGPKTLQTRLPPPTGRSGRSEGWPRAGRLERGDCNTSGGARRTDRRAPWRGGRINRMLSAPPLDKLTAWSQKYAV
jgi:hypothetical protein